MKEKSRGHVEDVVGKIAQVDVSVPGLIDSSIRRPVLSVDPKTGSRVLGEAIETGGNIAQKLPDIAHALLSQSGSDQLLNDVRNETRIGFWKVAKIGTLSIVLAAPVLYEAIGRGGEDIKRLVHWIDEHAQRWNESPEPEPILPENTNDPGKIAEAKEARRRWGFKRDVWRRWTRTTRDASIE